MPSDAGQAQCLAVHMKKPEGHGWFQSEYSAVPKSVWIAEDLGSEAANTAKHASTVRFAAASPLDGGSLRCVLAAAKNDGRRGPGQIDLGVPFPTEMGPLPA